MKHLTASNVQEVLRDCLFTDDECRDPAVTANAVFAETVMMKIGFHPERLKAHHQDIADMLSELPHQFRAGVGGGWSFLQACMTEDGTQWGEHPDVDALLGLGLASKQIEYCMPRDAWGVLPGGMAYFVILADGASEAKSGTET
jgi:hypothetical protein